jgi:ATP-dependent RNA helicase DeaD
VEARPEPGQGAQTAPQALPPADPPAPRQRLAAEGAPTQQQIDYAKGLLDGRDPAAVVALLLEMAQPTPVRQPMRISEPPAPESPSASEAAPGFVRFTINWGERAGAAPNRLLGHVCRRGQVRGHLVGAIEIGPDESSFDVDASVAARFEKLVRRPDRRDPRLRILRATAKRAPRGHGEQDRPRAKPRPKRRFGA